MLHELIEIIVGCLSLWDLSGVLLCLTMRMCRIIKGIGTSFVQKHLVLIAKVIKIAWYLDLTLESEPH